MIVFTLTKKLDFFQKYRRIVLFTDHVTYCVVVRTVRLLLGFVILIESLPTKFDVDYAIKFDV